MRIMFLVSSMQGGGSERVAALLCNQWVKEGHKVTLMPTYSGGGSNDYPLESAVKLEFLSDIVNNTSGGIANKVRRLLTLRRYIQQQKPDVVVSFLAPVNVIAVISTLGLKIPVIVSERSFPPSEPHSLLFNRVRQWAYIRAAAVVSQTDASKKWAETLSNKVNTLVIPNPLMFPVPSVETGIAPALAPEEFISDGKRMLLAVGRLVKDKDYPTLLDAFALVSDKHPDWTLVILGDGELEPMLKEHIKSLSLEARALLIGRVGNLDDWFRKADGFVMTSLLEGFPNAMLEATAYGVPCVSLDFEAGPRDILANGEAGIITPLDEGARGIARGLETLMSDEVLRAKYSAAAVKNRDVYAIDSISKQWISLFEQFTVER